MSEWTRDPGAAAFATSGSPTKVDAGGRHARARGMDEAYLDRQFVQGGLQESQSLEYKASAALGANRSFGRGVGGRIAMKNTLRATSILYRGLPPFDPSSGKRARVR